MPSSYHPKNYLNRWRLIGTGFIMIVLLIIFFNLTVGRVASTTETQNTGKSAQLTPREPMYFFVGDFDAKPDWTASMHPVLGSDNSYTITDGYKNRGLKALYEQGSYAGADSPVGKSATIFRISFGGEGINIGVKDDLYLRYRVRFMQGFEFVKTGKLPGLAGGESNSGGHPPNGYDGWSVRTTWRNGVPASYLYIPGLKKYGLELLWQYEDGVNAKFLPGQWHCIEIRVKLNAPGNKDGLLQGWLDDKLAIDRNDLLYRKTANLGIDNILFSTFFGGSDPSFASPKDQSATFDDFVLSKDKIGCTP